MMHSFANTADAYACNRVITGCWQLSDDHGSRPQDERLFALLRQRVEAGFVTFDMGGLHTQEGFYMYCPPS